MIKENNPTMCQNDKNKTSKSDWLEIQIYFVVLSVSIEMIEIKKNISKWK